MVNIEINGIPIRARDGSMVIEAADEAGIVIPRFCYHKKLSIAANCRMCLVEVEKVGKPLPACATPVTEGMKVFTRSPKALSAQKGVMEFLLINHPLDCPICDQGGECDLQEMAMGFGGDVSRYQESKRVVRDKSFGPLIASDMTRCIHCTRCVRFGQEVAGMWELGGMGRGEHTRIGTYVERTIDSEISGNVIDLCPVGALTSKPYRYTARPWELIAHESISPHDCVGANLKVDVRGSSVMRVLPRENEEVNETWIADRDRYSYLALAAEDRLGRPMVKRDGHWEETDWDTALTAAADGLKGVLEEHGPDQLAAWAGYTSTVEEFYLLQRLFRGVGSGNVDHRLRQMDFRDQERLPPFPWLGQSLVDLESLDAALLVGSNVRKEQPLVGVRLRKSAVAGGKVMFVNPLEYEFNFPVAEQLVVHPADMVETLEAIVRALAEMAGDSVPDGVGSAEVTELHRAVAKQLREGERAAVLLGNLTAYHPAQAELRALAALIARLAGARLGQLAEGGNAAGAWLAGAVPHRTAGGAASGKPGRDWASVVKDGAKAFLLLNTEPAYDCIDPAGAVSALERADFVVSLSPFADERSYAYADVLLPVSLFPETSGTFVNAEGRWQSFAGCVPPRNEARPAWKILRVLGNLLDVDGFSYVSSDEVLAEVREACDGVEPSSEVPWPVSGGQVRFDRGTIHRIVDFPIYAVDAMVRRSPALQETRDGQAGGVHMNQATAASARVGTDASVVVQQGGSASLSLFLNARVPDGCAYIPAGLPETSGLGAAPGAVEVEQG